jgi:UDP-N-acetylglucosamine--N-acetylmuramyl-(pentapeptide) pyrophosphoryl-undecaprenol N-acetylglucosamine transferase
MIMKNKNVSHSLHVGSDQKNKSSTICFVAGKSGGHILPALTLARHHKNKNPSSKVLFFSTDSALDNQLVQNNKLIDWYLPLAIDDVPYKKIHHIPVFLWHSLRSFLTSFHALRIYRPTRVVSLGGYISLPVCLAAKLLRIPIELYELNMVAGKAIKATVPLATTIRVCFPGAQQQFGKRSCTLEPYPLRFTAAHKAITRISALQKIGLCLTRKTIFVLGGSQGSVFINELIKKYLDNNPHLHGHIQVIHQTGTHDTTDWQRWYAHYEIPAIVFAYHHEVEYYYAAADLVVCRSGAGTLWEIVFFEKRAITIPLETHTTDHQLDNAQALAAAYPTLFTVITQQEALLPAVYTPNISDALFGHSDTSLPFN